MHILLCPEEGFSLPQVGWVGHDYSGEASDGSHFGSQPVDVKYGEQKTRQRNYAAIQAVLEGEYECHLRACLNRNLAERPFTATETNIALAHVFKPSQGRRCLQNEVNAAAVVNTDSRVTDLSRPSVRTSATKIVLRRVPRSTGALEVEICIR